MIKIVKKYPRTFLTMLLVFMFCCAIFLYFNKPGTSKFLPPCVFYSLTKFYCPGCGSARVMYSLLHGDVFTALRCNVLTVLFLPILAYYFLSFCLNTYFKRIILKPLKFNYFFSATICVTVILFWILRNIPVYPFIYLAPISLI